MKLKLTVICIGLNLLSDAQTPIGAPPAPFTVPNNANSAWYRGGNFPVGATPATANIFGTMWNSPVYHYTSGKQRMIVFDDTWNTAGSLGSGGSSTPFGGGVAINLNPSSPVTRPAALLTISNGNPNFVGGWRNWMQVGTFNYEGFNQLYVGMKTEPASAADGVINWGDNSAAYGAIRNYMRFIFTAPSGDPGYAGNPDGLEVMRMNTLGKIGIGNYFNNLVEAPFTKDPARRLEILSDKTAAGINGNPLLRLTHTQQDPTSPLTIITTGKFSEFQPMATGHLFINSRDNTQATTPFKDLKQRYIGINTNTPGNTVEINSQFAGSATANGFGGTGWAGLRFTDLKSTSTTNTLVTNKVLSVDANGDVILVTNTPTVSGLGNICGATVVPLLGNYQIEMTPAFNFNFTMPALSTSQVNIGKTACATNSARLYVENDKLRTAGSFSTNGTFTSTPYAVYGKTHNNAFNITTIGVYGEAEAQGPNAQAVGVEGKSVFLSAASAQNIGGKFTSANGTSNSTAGLFTISNSNSSMNYGIITNVNSAVIVGSNNTGILSNALAIGGNNNTAGTFQASGAMNSNIGIYASAPAGAITSSDYAGYFNGNVFINGIGTLPAGALITSDKNIKTNVVTLAKPLDLLLRLRPVSYNLNNAYAPQLNVDTAKTFGLIAQEVAVLFPTLVKEVIVPASYDTLGTVITPSVSLKALNYTGLIPLTISAIQDINKRQNTMQASLTNTGLSDALVKNNINNFNALAKIKTLNPVSYNFTNTGVPQLSFSPKLDYGFIAQQLQTVYPELVDTIRVPAKLDSLGAIINPSVVLKTVNYKAMSGLLTRAIQEQQVKIDSLLKVASKQDSINNAVQTQLTNLTNLINGCCEIASRKSNPVNSLDVELSDKDAIVLSQNVPNPFAEQTTINYNVPASVGKAQILFYNNTGQVIQTVDIKTRGKGKVNVFASDLSAGLYHYTLVADGKVIDSKKMVRE